MALLAGINVGGHRRVPMADLREVVADLGHTEVGTYIQSGNVVFVPVPGQSTEQVADGLASGIEKRFGFAVHVVVLSAGQLADVVARSPWPEASEPKQLHVGFSRQPVSAHTSARVAEAQQRTAAKGSRDEAKVVEGVLYLHTPDGLGRSELAVQLGRLNQRSTDPTTMRNWATVQKLAALSLPHDS